MKMHHSYSSEGLLYTNSVITLSEQLMLISKPLLLFLLIATWTSTTTSSMARPEARVKLPPGIIVTAVSAFGNSFVDTGNNNYLPSVTKANYLPYGKDFMGGNMPNGRFSNGRILTDLIAEVLGIKEYVPAYLDPNLKPEELLTGVCFASAGSGYDPLTDTIRTALPLTKQLDLFKDYIEKLKSMVGESQASFIIDTTFFAIDAGSNDIATYFDIPVRRIHYEYNSYADLLLNKSSSFIKELYRLGARKMVVVGAPPIGCLPIQRTVAGGLRRQCAATNNQLSQLFNSKLAKEIGVLKTLLPGSILLYGDFYSIFTDIINDPHKYGLEVVDRGCCGTGTVEVAALCNILDPVCLDDTKYLFWDSAHPTQTGYQIIVDQLVPQLLKKLVD